MINSRTAVSIYTDWSSKIGLGHIKRCIALSQAFNRRRIATEFILDSVTPALEREIRTAGASIRIQSSPAELDKNRFDGLSHWILFDHPNLEASQETALALKGNQRIAVIDGQFRSHQCDLLINPNIYATEENCRPTVLPSTRVLAGYDYFLLEDQFLDNRLEQVHTLDDNPSVLLALGGADPSNLIGAACEALIDLLHRNQNWQLDVVVGPAHHNPDSIRVFKESVATSNLKVHFSATSLFKILSRADICICAGGTTLSEAVFLNKPTLSIETAKNQRPVIKALALLGATKETNIAHLSRDLECLANNTAFRNSLIDQTTGLLDGKGKDRIADALLNY